MTKDELRVYLAKIMKLETERYEISLAVSQLKKERNLNRPAKNEGKRDGQKGFGRIYGNRPLLQDWQGQWRDLPADYLWSICHG